MAKKSEKIELDKLPEDFVPIVYRLPEPKEDIFNEDPNPSFSTNIAYPKFSLGFYHYIHQSKDKMEITKEFEGKKKVYLVFNKFERYIDDYEYDINNSSKVYFDLSSKPNILSRAFYKLWELFFLFDIIPVNSNGFTSAHLAEGPGSFVQATMFFRDKFIKKGFSTKNDKYYAITLQPEDNRKHVPEVERTFVEYYSKEKPVRFTLHRTFNNNISRQSNKKDNGDITKLKTIRLFEDDLGGDKADFITADGGFEWQNENVQEQESFKLILSEILTAARIQAKNGNFVCKFFESFTDVTLAFIEILESFYTTVFISKPLMSRQSNSEKYLVCLGFLYDNKSKEKQNKIKVLEDILERMNEEGLNVINIFKNYKKSDQFITTIIRANTEIANRQFKKINEIVDFIQRQNYRGDEYQKRRDMQIDATKYWIDLFFPAVENFENNKKVCQNLRDQILEKNNNLIKNLQKKINFDSS